MDDSADTATYHALLRDLRDPVFRYLLRMTRDRQDAEDLLQEVFFSAWRHLDQLRSASGARSWVFAIAVNAVRSHGRRERLRPWARLGQRRRSDEADEPPSSASLAVRAALGQSSESDRNVLVLVGTCGLSAAETAEILGISADAVHKRWQRARNRFISTVETMRIER